jgi:hypothetical protein
MDYSPSAFTLGGRDVVASWLICLVVAAIGLIYPTLAATPHAPSVAAQTSPVAICTAPRSAVTTARG